MRYKAFEVLFKEFEKDLERSSFIQRMPLKEAEELVVRKKKQQEAIEAAKSKIVKPTDAQVKEVNK